MFVTEEEVLSLLHRWFQAVHQHASISEQLALFNHPHPRIFAPDGSSFDLIEHNHLHMRWHNEQHELGPLEIVPLDKEGLRVKVSGTVYWQAERKDDQGIIKAVVGELWFMHKNAKGELKFAFYHSTFFHLLPGSAALSLD